MISASIVLARAEFRLDAELESGASRLAVFGASGAGKTTLLDAIAGLVRPASGRIDVGGRVLFDSVRGIDLPPRDRGVGYVRQTPDLFPTMSVAGNVTFARGRRRSPGPAAATDEVERALGVAPLARRRPADLSGGETRRVQIARALASRPNLLLLDEPFANLDAAARREILPLLAEIPGRFGVPAILVTHDAEEVFAFAEEVVILERGRIAARGEPHATLSRPGVWPVARLSGVENFLAGRLVSADAREGESVVSWEGVDIHCPVIAAPAGSTVTLALFAEDVLLARGEAGRLSARNVLAMRVESVADDGSTLLVTLADGPRRLRSRITRRARAALDVAPGAEVAAVFKSSSVRPIAELSGG